MNLQEALLFADEILFRKTGRHLDDIQLGLLEGVLQRKRYSEIATELNCTEGYLKDVGYELWKLFSELFGEEVNKSNLRSNLMRHQVKNKISVDVSNNKKVNQINICTNQENLNENTVQLKILMPEIVRRLRMAGLREEQIADCLGLSTQDLERI